MYKQYILLILFSCFLIFGCGMEKEIDYKTYYAGDEIVVHGFISQDEGVQAIVRKTVSPAQSNNNDTLINPSVWLYENDKPLTQLINCSTSKYVSPKGITLSSSANYTIHVSCNGLEDVVSKQQKLVDRMYIDTAYISANYPSFRTYNVALEFNDIPDENNYFMVQIHKFYNGVDDYKAYNEFISAISVKRDADYFAGKIIQEYEIQNSAGVNNFKGFDSIRFDLITVSEDYYKYGRSVNYYDLTNNSEFDENVYPIYSNITNGVGFFVSYERTSYNFIPGAIK